MAELKPCPFCGSEDLRVIYKIENNSPKIFMVFCEICCAEGPFDLTETEAIDAWNKRS